jgi:hypothetical protein
MPLQTSGTISLSQIQTEYGGVNNLSISEYYNGGPNSTPNVSTSRISKIRMKGVSGTTDGNADIREFEFDGLGDWGTGDRRTGNNEITISTNMITISDPNSNTQPPLNAWINGSKELDTPDSRYLVGQVTINSNYYIEFEFVGSATKPLVNDFNKLKIYWDKSDISLDADMGTWEIMVYNQDGMELSYGNITLSESNIVSTGSSGLSTYVNTGNNQTPYSITFTQNTTCDILIIGGGGSGGKSMSANRGGGGGGAGGLIYITSTILPADTYTLNVGNGGLGSSSGQNGYDSSIVSTSINYIAYGGGGGGNVIGGGGSSGGSGGGGSDYNGYGGTSTNGGGTGTTYVYGFNGGQASQPSGYGAGGSGAGGGGAGGLGQNASGYSIGNGGSSKNIDITGTLIQYAKGGDGGLYAGGTGTNGENNKGNGGAGAGRNGTQRGGNGGSGIIIINIISSNSEVWQYFTSTYISDGEALRSTEYFSPQDIDQNPTKLAEKTSNSISSGYLGFIWANPAPNHGVPAGAVSFDFVRTNEANTITQTYNRQGSMNNYDGNKRHMFVHIANATAAGVYQTKSYATFKNADGSNYTSSGGSNEPVITPSVSINDLGDNYKYIVFQNTGNSQTSYNITFNESTICDILVVGGGGSGGVRDAGAGGAGGLIYLTNVNILNSNLSVGKGAASRSSGSHISGDKGNDSYMVINSITYTAEGGGKGGQWNGSNNNSTGSGGSGGGGGGNNSAGGTGNQPSSTSGGYGNNGAQGSGSYSGGGGGGAGGAGTRHSGDTGGNGGIGMNFSAIFGTDYGENGWFAGGGGMGSGSGANGTGGQGGGGNGANSGAAEGGMDGTGGGGGGHRNSGGTSGKGGDGIIIIRYLNNTTSHYLEFNLGTPSAIASGGYVSGVSYIPTHSQPYTAISFSDFYYQVPSGPPNPPNQTANKGVSGGLGNTGYEIITGLYANNTTRTEGTTSFDNRGAGGRGSSNNVAYMNLIIQAKPGDVLNLIGRINTSGTYNEYCEFWVWLGSSWSRFTSPNASFGGNRDFNVNYTIPSNTVAGNYALAVACSYSSLGSSSYRSWKSYSLEVWV